MKFSSKCNIGYQFNSIQIFYFSPVKILIRAIFPQLSTSLIKLLNLQFVDKKAEAFFKPMIENEIKRRNDIATQRGDFLDFFLTMKNRHQNGGKL